MAATQFMSSPLDHRQAGGRGNLVSLSQSSSSPTRPNQELPEAFDTSFGSQMSISSSSEEFQFSRQHLRNNSEQYYQQNTLKIHHSPLGAALGTVLNARSPGLAAKLNSSTSSTSSRMDISPPSDSSSRQRPRSSTLTSEMRRASAAATRRAQGYSESHVNDGFGNRNGNASQSNMSISDVSMASLSHERGNTSGGKDGGDTIGKRKSKEFRESASSSTSSSTTSSGRQVPSSPPRSHVRSKTNSGSDGGRSRSSSASIEKPRYQDTQPQCPPSAGSTLGRLFGMELSLNDNQDEEEGGEEEYGRLGEDRDPTLKRRPSSLPLGGGSALSRPSIANSGILGGGSTSSRPRPNLMQSFTSKSDSNNEHTVRKQTSADSISPNYFSGPCSNSSSSTSSLGRPARSRHSSVESVFDAPSQPQRTSLGYLPSVHDTIIESPSPAALERREGLGDYFFDPQSPEQQAAAPSQPSRPSSRASGSTKRSASPPNGTRRPGPRPALGIRKLEKAHSSAVVPTRGALQPGLSSGSGTARTLGKRSNPYGSGSKGSGSSSRNSQLGSGNGNGNGTADPIKRLTAPAPRRTQSASDYSATFSSLAQASANAARSNLADISMGSSAADSSMEQSPVRKRTMMGNDYPAGFDAGSPMGPAARAAISRPSMLRNNSKDDASPLGYGTGIKRSNSRPGQGEDDSMVGISNSPGPSSSPFMPGFGASEKEGKVLPCFSVSNDGLMRVSSNTVSDLLEGKYDSEIQSFHIIDCRFGYEYEGGHIPGAINLNTLEKVKHHFLTPNEGLHSPNLPLPIRSQSGKPDKSGQLKKQVLVFHCEFSAKRAPSMALALRQADRSLNHDYPNCHFPEIYILKGGYCEFFSDFSKKCSPNQYIRMDDPRFITKCSNELGAYRKQFERHRSFTYGDTKGGINSLSSNPLMMAAGGNANKRRLNNNSQMIKEDERDNSNTSNSSSNLEDSPSMAAVGRKTVSLQPGALNGGGKGNLKERRPSMAGSRTLTLGPTRPTSSISTLNPNYNGMTQSNSNVSMTNGDVDVSFSSSTGDSSFEGDSPCAAASRRPSLLNSGNLNHSSTSIGAFRINANDGNLTANGNGNPALGRLKLQRAGTTPNVNFSSLIKKRASPQFFIGQRIQKSLDSFRSQQEHSFKDPLVSPSFSIFKSNETH